MTTYEAYHSMMVWEERAKPSNMEQYWDTFAYTWYTWYLQKRWS